MHSSFCNAVHLVAWRKISLLMVIMGLGLVIGSEVKIDTDLITEGLAEHDSRCRL